jgi:ferredoxin
MKVRVDSDRCMGHGMCATLVSEVFHVNNESGMNEMGEFDLSPGLRASALRGASGCPERAIAVIDDFPA